MKVDSGIYKFKNEINGKVYIGQTKYLKSRYSQHKTDLLRGVHHNPYFQKEVDKYGFDKFKYSVIKRCEVKELDYWESYFFNVYNSRDRKYGYNIKDAGNESSLPDEIKYKIKISNRGKNNKLTPDEVENIKLKRLNGEKCVDLAKFYNVTISAISKITMCKNWAYIREDLNDKLLEQAEKEAEEIKRVVKSYYEQGYRPEQIKQKTKISNQVILRILSDELKHEKEIEKMVVQDFMSMCKIDDILNKRNITYAKYKRITKGLKPKRDLLIYEKIVTLKKQGVLVKDIAKMLKINRSTVNDICKRFSNNVNIEVIKGIKEPLTP